MSSDETTNERTGYLMLNNATPEEWEKAAAQAAGIVARADRTEMSKDLLQKAEDDSFPEESGLESCPDFDMVNNPLHYNNGSIECIDGIKAMLTDEEFIGYLRGNSLKYRWRYPHKNGVEDLKKAGWYENKLLEVLEDVRKKLS